MKILIYSLATLLLGACSAKVPPEQIKAIDHNFAVMSGIIKGMDARVKALEDKASDKRK
jgi:hypothetical protein